uniref:Uncharacterized protein n=1 Tax=Steinernema glaseri TaxID=37863 RepID=A0A1I7YWA5_9BILA
MVKPNEESMSDAPVKISRKCNLPESSHHRLFSTNSSSFHQLLPNRPDLVHVDNRFNHRVLTQQCARQLSRHKLDFSVTDYEGDA